MLAISARIELASKDIAAYIAAAQSIIEPTHAEPGCHLYAIAVDINLPNVIWITEQWENDEALLAHLGYASYCRLYGLLWHRGNHRYECYSL